MTINIDLFEESLHLRDIQGCLQVINSHQTPFLDSWAIIYQTANGSHGSSLIENGLCSAVATAMQFESFKESRMVP